MIVMSGYTAFGAEGQHYLRTKPADMECQLADHAIEVLPVELAVGIVEDFAFGDLQNRTGGSELETANSREFVIIFDPAAMGGGLPWGQADDAGLDAAIVIESQRASEIAGFVVGMRGYAHHAQHSVIVT